jgi:hypothetical protein
VSFTRRLVVGSLAALLAGMLLAVGVVVAKRAIETNALIFFTSPNTFNGSVTSPVGDCIPKRDVTVKRVRDGRDKALATARSRGQHGYYETTVGGAVRTGQEFYAAVAGRRVDAGKCAPGRSGTTTIG